jgi:predicted MFS family arabinose efflux permease
MTGLATSAARRFRLPFYGWRIVVVLAVTELVSWGVLYYSFAVFLVPMQDDLGFSRATLTGAYALALLLSGLAAVPVGRWLDRHGPRALMTLGSVAATGLVVAWSQVRTVAGLYLVFAGIGLVSAAVLYDPAFAVVVRWFAARRARALLTLTVIAGFSSTVFLPLANALVLALGWRDALGVLAAGLAVTTVLPHALVLRRDPADLGLHPDGSAAPPPATATAGGPRRALREAARFAARDRTYRLLTLAFTANIAAIVVVSVHLVPYLREQGHSATFAASVTGALGALSVAGRLGVTAAARWWSPAAVTATMFGVQALAVVVLLLAGRSVAGAVGFVVLFGLGFGVGTLGRPALLAQHFGVRDFATLSGLLAIPLTAAMTAGPLAAGVVRTATGGYTPVLIGLVVVCAVSAAAVARVGDPAAGR